MNNEDIKDTLNSHPFLKKFDWKHWKHPHNNTFYHGHLDELEFRIWRNNYGASGYTMLVIFNDQDKTASDTKLVFRSYPETINEGIEEINQQIEEYFSKQIKLKRIWDDHQL